MDKFGHRQMQQTSILFLGGWAIPLEAYQPLMQQFLKADFTGKVSLHDYGFFHSGDSPMLLPAQGDNGASVLVAHSMGCIPALRMAADRKDWEALILMNPFASFCAHKSLCVGWKQENVNAMREKLLAEPDSLLRAFYRSCAAPEHCRIAVPKVINLEALGEGLELLRDSNASDILSGISCPVLILDGAPDDQVVSSDMTGYLADRLSNGKRHSYRNAGHLLPLTHASVCADDILGFLHQIRHNSQTEEKHG